MLDSIYHITYTLKSLFLRENVFVIMLATVLWTSLCNVTNYVNHKWFIDSNMSRDMRFQTMWYVRPTMPQISLRIRAV